MGSGDYHGEELFLLSRSTSGEGVSGFTDGFVRSENGVRTLFDIFELLILSGPKKGGDRAHGPKAHDNQDDNRGVKHTFYLSLNNDKASNL